MIELTDETVRELCDMADCVDVSSGGCCELTISLTGKPAQVVKRWTAENLRRQEQEFKQTLARLQHLANNGDPTAMEAIAARRDRVAGKRLTVQQIAAIRIADIGDEPEHVRTDLNSA